MKSSYCLICHMGGDVENLTIFSLKKCVSGTKQNKRAAHNPFQSSLCGMEVSQMEEVFRTGRVCVCVCVDQTAADFDLRMHG